MPPPVEMMRLCLLQDAGFQVTEVGFPVNLENLRNAHARLLLDQLVRICKAQIRFSMQFLPDGRFAAPHQPDQDDVRQGGAHRVLHTPSVTNPPA